MFCGVELFNDGVGEDVFNSVLTASFGWECVVWQGHSLDRINQLPFLVFAQIGTG